MRPTTVALLVLVVAPATIYLALSALSVVLDVLSGTPSARVAHLLERLPRRAHPAREPMPPVLFALELRRLAHEVDEVDRGNQPAKAARLAACTTAYDIALLEYCHAVDIPVDAERAPLRPEQRLAAEAALLAAGHDW